MPWYFYLLEFLGGVFLSNGIPHFVQGISGNWFQSPFAKPPGVGESSPVVNVVWGFANLVAGALLLCYFRPMGQHSCEGWSAVWAGALVMGILMSLQFGKVRGNLRSNTQNNGATR
jgi:hypothetical protein